MCWQVGDKIVYGSERYGVHPIRCNVSKRQQHERAQMRTRMRQNQIRLDSNQIAHRNDVKVEGARRIDHAAPAACDALNFLKNSQKIHGVNFAA